MLRSAHFAALLLGIAAVSHTGLQMKSKNADDDDAMKGLITASAKATGPTPAPASSPSSNNGDDDGDDDKSDTSYQKQKAAQLKENKVIEACLHKVQNDWKKCGKCLHCLSTGNRIISAGHLHTRAGRRKWHKKHCLPKSGVKASSFHVGAILCNAFNCDTGQFLDVPPLIPSLMCNAFRTDPKILPRHQRFQGDCIRQSRKYQTRFA